MRILLLVVAGLLLIRSLHGLYRQASVGGWIRLVCALGIIAWAVTGLEVLGYAAAVLAGMALVSVVAEYAVGRRTAHGRKTSKQTPSVEEPFALRRARARFHSMDEIRELSEERVYAYLRDADRSVRWAAAERLRAVGTPENTQRIVDRLTGPEPETDPKVRLTLALVLARWGRQEAVAELVQALDPDRLERREALQALVRLEARRHVPDILKLAANEPQDAASVDAIHTAVRLGGGNELLQIQHRDLVLRYVRSAPDVLPAALADVAAVAKLLRDSGDAELRYLGDRLGRLLQYAELSEARIAMGDQNRADEG
jgi:HEAT repeat protein